MTPQVPSPDGGGSGGGTIDLGTLEACCADTNTAINNLTAELDQVEELLTAIGTNTDGLEACCATTNGNLTTIIGHVDGLEALLTAVGTNTDGLEALLTAIGTNTDGLEGQLTTVIGHVDGLEGLATTANATLSTISTSVDGLETLSTATNALLTTIDGRVDGLEGLSTAANALLTTISASVDQLEGYVDGLEGLITTTNTLLTTLTQATFLEDAAHASGARGVFALGVRNDADAVRTSADGDYSPISVDSAGRLKITGSVTATSGPAQSLYRNLDVNNVGKVIKGSAGQVLSVQASNRANAERFLKLYNKATAPIVGTDIPVLVIPLDGRSGGGQADADISFQDGGQFSLGIGIAATTGIADSDTGNPSVNNVVVNVGFR